MTTLANSALYVEGVFDVKNLTRSQARQIRHSGNLTGE
jgi:hypothetical protein